MKKTWLLRALFGATLAGSLFIYLRPVLGEKRAAEPARVSSAKHAERSLYLLDSSFETDAQRPLKLAELRGNFQILALIFTRCPTVCPTLVHEMQALERAMPSAVREATHFTLVSIDPAHDTPEALLAYREKHGLNKEHWSLLRGEPDTVRELSALLGFSYGGGSGLPLAHSKQVTVLNRNGEIIHQQESVASDPDKIIDAIQRAL